MNKYRYLVSYCWTYQGDTRWGNTLWTSEWQLSFIDILDIERDITSKLREIGIANDYSTVTVINFQRLQ
jgi:hypothetical protein